MEIIIILERILSVIDDKAASSFCTCPLLKEVKTEVEAILRDELKALDRAIDEICAR